MTINFQIPSLAALLAASVLALAPVAASAAETLNWVTYKAKGAGDPQAITTQWFADELERRTDGEYKIRIHWGGSVAGPKEIPTAIENGTGDMGDVITPYFPDLLPINNAISFHVPQPHSSIELGLLMTYWHEVFPAFSEELARYNMIAVGMRPLESYGILCTKPVRSVEEFKGLRVRSYGHALPAVVEALGAVPVAMSTNDTYEGLSRGIIDCSPVGPTLARGWKFDEVAKYYIDVPLGASWGHLINMNKAKFDSLPKEVQLEIKSIGSEYLVRYTTEMLKQDVEIRKAWKGELGVEFITIDGAAFNKAMLADAGVQKVRADWVAKVQAAGFEPDAIVEVLTAK
jgi:TRAP-type C4-dicarboxylate transport system substrate-binding protein